MVRVVLRHQTLTLLVAAGTLVLTIYLYVIVPKGFFPVQDTGAILGISASARDGLFFRNGPGCSSNWFKSFARIQPLRI